MRVGIVFSFLIALVLASPRPAFAEEYSTVPATAKPKGASCPFGDFPDSNVSLETIKRPTSLDQMITALYNSPRHGRLVGYDQRVRHELTPGLSVLKSELSQVLIDFFQANRKHFGDKDFSQLSHTELTSLGEIFIDQLGQVALPRRFMGLGATQEAKFREDIAKGMRELIGRETENRKIFPQVAEAFMSDLRQRQATFFNAQATAMREDVTNNVVSFEVASAFADEITSLSQRAIFEHIHDVPHTRNFADPLPAAGQANYPLSTQRVQALTKKILERWQRVRQDPSSKPHPILANDPNAAVRAASTVGQVSADPNSTPKGSLNELLNSKMLFNDPRSLATFQDHIAGRTGRTALVRFLVQKKIPFTAIRSRVVDSRGESISLRLRHWGREPNSTKPEDHGPAISQKAFEHVAYEFQTADGNSYVMDPWLFPGKILSRSEWEAQSRDFLTFEKRISSDEIVQERIAFVSKNDGSSHTTAQQKLLRRRENFQGPQKILAERIHTELSQALTKLNPEVAYDLRQALHSPEFAAYFAIRLNPDLAPTVLQENLQAMSQDWPKLILLQASIKSRIIDFKDFPARAAHAPKARSNMSVQDYANAWRDFALRKLNLNVGKEDWAWSDIESVFPTKSLK